MAVGDDEELLGGEDDTRIGGLIAQELGDQAARTFTTVWRAFDEWEQRHHPDAGLRERKKRLTRQRISDVATALFVTRGFDHVPVSEIAEKVGVSEKTIYNYFPTKESLVYDHADDQLARLADAIRERASGISPIAAFVAELKADTARFSAALGDERLEFIPRFGEMIRQTPSLRAAWGEHRHRMVESLSEALSADFGVDPRDPEILVAARALVSLLELLHDSQLRRIEDGVGVNELQAAVDADLDRAARLLETGFWSMQLLVEGRRTKQQLRDTAAAAEQARRQVLAALRDAKRAWRQVRRQAHAAGVAEAAAARHEAAAARAQARHAAAAARAQARHAAAAALAQAQQDAAAARARAQQDAAAARAHAREPRQHG